MVWGGTDVPVWTEDNFPELVLSSIWAQKTEFWESDQRARAFFC